MTREVQPDPSTISDTGYREAYERSWAVVIGIDAYQKVRPLSHAVHDACDVADLLVTKFEFPREHVTLLLEPAPLEIAARYSDRIRPATKESIEEILLTELPERVGPDDRVIVFYAGHGEAISPDRPGVWYMVPTGGDPRRPHTLVDVRAVFDALEHAEAKHVLYVLDACYAGMATARGDAAPQRFRGEMLTTRVHQVLSAGSARQAVADLGPNGRNSLFTHYLIEGLRFGDINQDGAITAGELGEYVRRRVEEAFGSAQRPEFGIRSGAAAGDFVFDVPRSWLTPAERLRTATLLIDALGLGHHETLGLRHGLRLIDELTAQCPAFARNQPEIPLLRRRAVTGLREMSGRSAGQAHRDGDMAAESRLCDALDALRGGSNEIATDILRTLAGGDGEHAVLAGWLLQQIVAERQARVALLIGIGEYESGRRLAGPRNDVTAMRSLLTQTFGFNPSDVLCLVDRDASAAHVTAVLSSLPSRLPAGGSVVCYLAGAGVRSSDGSFAFCCHDAVSTNEDSSEPIDVASLTPERGYLHEHALTRLDYTLRWGDHHEGELVVIADACHVAPAQHTSARFLAGSSREGTCYEVTRGEVSRGAFTLAIEQVLASGPLLPAESVMRRVTDQVRAEVPQTPTWATPLSGREPVIRGLASSATIALAAPYFQPRGIAVRELRRHLSFHEASPYPPELQRRLSKGFSARRWFAEAHQALTGAPMSLETARSRTETAVAAGAYAQAEMACEAWLRIAEGDTRLVALQERLRAAAARTKRVAVIRGADTEERVTALARKRGLVPYRDSTGKVVCEDWADIEQMLRDLVSHPDDPTLLVVEADGIVPLRDRMALQLGQRESLVIDLQNAIQGHRALTTIVVLHSGSLPDSYAVNRLGALGTLTFVGINTQPGRDLQTPPPTLLSLLWSKLASPVWRAEDLTRALPLRLIGDPKARLFEHPDDARSIESALRNILDQPLEELTTLLDQMSPQQDGGDEARMLAAAVLTARGKPSQAELVADEALRRRRNAAPDSPVWPDVHFVRGRALLSQNKLEEAVAALTTAARQAVDDAQVLYYRAVAIRRLINEDLKRRADEAADAYDALGAPLGDLDDLDY